jgi:hypothetical protein
VTYQTAEKRLQPESIVVDSGITEESQSIIDKTSTVKAADNHLCSVKNDDPDAPIPHEFHPEQLCSPMPAFQYQNVNQNFVNANQEAAIVNVFPPVASENSKNQSQALMAQQSDQNLKESNTTDGKKPIRSKKHRKNSSQFTFDSQNGLNSTGNFGITNSIKKKKPAGGNNN